MTNKQDIDCASKLSLLSNDIRLKVVRVLMDGPASVSELLKKIPIEQNLMSHHLRLLREGKLVTSQRVGKGVSYKLDGDMSTEIENEVNLGCCRLSF
ncbi:MAG: metalloregulator ArsR/SmtB family transcription factor [Maricaulaceae bacterium]